MDWVEYLTWFIFVVIAGTIVGRYMWNYPVEGSADILDHLVYNSAHIALLYVIFTDILGLHTYF